MKGRRGELGFLVASCLFTLIATSALGQPGPNDPRIQRLMDKARDSGAVRILVELEIEGGFRPEARRRGAAVARQRASIGAAQADLRDAMSLHDARIKTEFEVIPHVAMVVDPAALAALAQSPLVRSIVEDRLLRMSLRSTIPVIGADDAWALGYSGGGQAVAILDTGIEAGHPFFGGRVVAEACYSTNDGRFGSGTLCPNGRESMTGSGAASTTRCTGISGCDHGTHVAGIAAGSGSSFHGVAPAADIVAIQVFSRFSNTSICGSSAPCLLSWTSDQISGLQQVYELRKTHDIAAVNLSLGGGRETSTCDTDSPAFTSIVETLLSAGIATVIASGNNGFSNATGFPGCISSAITVGATRDNDTVISFSNSATWVDLLAPGVSVRSSVLGGGFGTKSGTSMATPHVTGTWALLKSADPTAGVERMLVALQGSGVPVLDTRNGLTIPRIALDLAVGQLVGTPEVTSPPPGNTLSGASQPFEWTANGAPVSEWRLTVGSTPGASDYYDSGTLTTVTSDTATGLPTDGSTIHVRLSYRIGVTWLFEDVQYTARAPMVVLDPLTSPIVVGGPLTLAGSGFTAGSVVNLFVATGAGVASFGPFTPSSWASDVLQLDVDPTIPLGNGFGSVLVVNTDQGFMSSNVVTQLLYGEASHNIPTILSIDSVGLSPMNPTIPTAFVETVVTPGATITLTGTGFENPLLNLFTAAGNLGPIAPLSVTSTTMTLAIPVGAPTGPVSFQVVNAPYTGNVLSNAVSTVMGARLTIHSVAQAGTTITVKGTGFSTLSVVNFFNLQGGTTANLGGIDGSGNPKIPVSFIDETELSFTVPSGAQSGPSFVQVLNPPFNLFSSSGSDADGAFDVTVP